jgi:predicted dehydrogenase
LRLKDVILQAICDKNENLAQETAARFHIPGAYPGLSEMLSTEKLDIVDICTPPQIHAPIAIEALQHGCHVLMEKPMALKVTDCDQMIDAAHKSGAKLCIIHNKLFDLPFLKAMKLVADGAIGDFTGMRIFLSDPREEMIMRKDYWIHKLPGGLIGETGPHLVYMSLAFLNRVKSVDIYANNFLEHPWAAFDEFRIELEGERAMSSIALSYAGNHRDLYVHILGTEGVLHLDLCSRLLFHYGRKVSVKPIPFARYISSISSQIIGGVVANAFKLATGRLRLGHDIILERFVDSILRNHQPPVTGEEGRETVRIMEMIVERLHAKYSI